MMKTIFKKDLRGLLPARIMMIVAFLVLELTVVLGVVTKNVSLTSTTIYLMVFFAFGMLVYHVYEAGNIFLGNLRTHAYFETMKKEGISYIHVVLCKLVITVGSMVVYATLFFGALALDVLAIIRRFPEEKEGIGALGFREMVTGGSDPFVMALLTTILEYVTIMLVLVALAYFSVIMNYAFFVRQRFAGLCSTFIYMTFVFVIVKANTMVSNVSVGIAQHVIACAVNLVLTAIALAVALPVLRRKILLPREQEQ